MTIEESELHKFTWECKDAESALTLEVWKDGARLSIESQPYEDENNEGKLRLRWGKFSSRDLTGEEFKSLLTFLQKQL